MMMIVVLGLSQLRLFSEYFLIPLSTIMSIYEIQRVGERAGHRWIGVITSTVAKTPARDTKCFSTALSLQNYLPVNGH